MQHTMGLTCRYNVTGIAFKLDMQFTAYFALLAETIFLQMTKYYFHYAHKLLTNYEDIHN